MWSGFTPPNVDWCEQELCAWVTNPANTWSNVAYLVVGIWIWRRARRSGRPELQLFGPATVAVGVFSGIYHASYTWALQLFDFVGMFLFCFLVLTSNALRLDWIRPERRLALALRWLKQFSIARSEKTMAERLAAELTAAANSEGASVKKREDTHRMADANKAFAHYHW